MKLFRTKTWNWLDIGLLKWCCILLGMVAGAYLHGLVLQHVGVILIAAVLLAIRPAIAYFKD